MSVTLGLDVGAAYTKALLLDGDRRILARRMAPTGYRLQEVAGRLRSEVGAEAGVAPSEIACVISTGFGRHLVPFRDLQVTDLTAAARGACSLFPGTRTILDIGGQTMKASRLDDRARVVAFRLNDKCAAGTGAFLEKTARYMGYSTGDIGRLLALSQEGVAISGVCAVFAESEVISHLSQGVPPEEIMLGAILSLTDRSVQLLKRMQAQPEHTLVGGILRWQRMAQVMRERLRGEVNVPEGDLAQYAGALGCALLGQLHLEKRATGTAARL